MPALSLQHDGLFRAFKKSAFLSLHLSERGESVFFEMTLLAIQHGLVIDEYPTIERLAGHLGNQGAAASGSLAGGGGRVNPPPAQVQGGAGAADRPDQRIEDLSEAQAEALLLQKLAAALGSAAGLGTEK